jgi:hypothetical protein
MNTDHQIEIAGWAAENKALWADVARLKQELAEAHVEIGKLTAALAESIEHLGVARAKWDGE